MIHACSGGSAAWSAFHNDTSGRAGEIVMACNLRFGMKKPHREDDRKIWYCGGNADWLPIEA